MFKFLVWCIAWSLILMAVAATFAAGCAVGQA
uniref:Lipoprotein n=1 Tax=uncultured bacterium 5G4 TaxID=1701326 RepID=A0A166H2I0_9BACT|nr:hypothetical protein 5G4_002 [uncultured bacterium 5G4]